MSTPHLSHEDIGSLSLAVHDFINQRYSDFNENEDFTALYDLLEKELDRFSIGYRNYN